MNLNEKKIERAKALLNDKKYEWRTEKVLKIKSGMSDEEFEVFRKDYDLEESLVPDVFGNKLWRIFKD